MNDLKNKNVLITSGPTRSYIDSVRYITNTSTGKLGSIITSEFLRNNAKVTFLYGKGSETPKIKSKKIKLKEISTTTDLLVSVVGLLKKHKFDIIVHSAGVLDYDVTKQENGKVKSNRNKWVITLKKTPKIIDVIKKISNKSFLIGFKLEAGTSRGKLVKSAYKLLKKSNADLIVANDLKKIKRDKHNALIIDKNGSIIASASTKKEIAQKLIKIIKNEKH